MTGRRDPDLPRFPKVFVQSKLEQVGKTYDFICEPTRREFEKRR
jgi:hypothetical protein